MNPLTLEWVAKAEGDYVTKGRERRARETPNFDAACFHAEQVAEKYLKAMLQESGLPIPKTHSLADLLAICIKNDPSIQLIQSNLNIMEGFAVQFRYPGQSASKADAKEAFEAAKVVRTFIRSRLGL